MSSKDFRLLWVDIETTGLDPDTEGPLEIAMFMTDPKLNLMGRQISYLVHPGDGYLVDMGDFVRDMHTKNGLLDALGEDPQLLSASQVDAKCFSWIHDNKGDRHLVLAGSGTHFEGQWLPVWFPLVNETLHYRQVNLSMLKVLLDREDPKPAHRAMSDLVWSLNLLREFMVTYQDGVDA